MKLLNLIVAGALFASVGAVSASESDNEPLALTEAQMDNVTAAGTAFADAWANSFGWISSYAYTNVNTGVYVVQIIPTQAGQITVDYTFSSSYSEAAAY